MKYWNFDLTLWDPEAKVETSIQFSFYGSEGDADRFLDGMILSAASVGKELTGGFSEG